MNKAVAGVQASLSGLPKTETC